MSEAPRGKVMVTERFDEVRSFMDRFLSPKEGSWPPSLDVWRFRGQANANLPLIPSALRPGARLDFTPGSDVVAPYPTYRQQLEAEYELLHTFFERMDSAGVAIPGDSQLHRSAQLDDWWNDWLEDMRKGKDTWPPHDLLSLMAVAQHYGVPTRLLDWTRNPLVAAYFAAKELATQRADKLPPPSEMAIWGFSSHALPRRGESQRWIEVVSAPAAAIPNLAVQEGIFTLIHDPQPEAEPVRTTPFDIFLEELVSGTEHPPPAIVKLTLPAARAPELLRVLSHHRIDASTVFAGHQAAAEAVKERRLRDQ